MRKLFLLIFTTTVLLIVTACSGSFTDPGMMDNPGWNGGGKGNGKDGFFDDDGSGSGGSYGNAYLKYTWVNKPQSFSDSNPSTPNTVSNGVYFYTNPGKYTLKYTAANGSTYSKYYTITVEKDRDVYFEIALNNSGPTMYYKYTP